VSHRATLYTKDLQVCPNGEAVSRMEKLVLYALADYHQDRLGVNTYPSVASLAEESLMDERMCRRLLASLERKGVLAREWGENQGRSHVTFYRFLQLDQAGKGGCPRPPSAAAVSGERGTKGGQKGGKSGTPSMEEQEQEQKQILPPIPPQAGGSRQIADVRDEETQKPETCATAEARVAAAMGLTRRRDLARIRAAMGERVARGEPPGAVADAMIAEHRKPAELRKREAFEARLAADEAQERRGWEIWQSMGPAYKAEKPWRGRVFEREAMR